MDRIHSLFFPWSDPDKERSNMWSLFCVILLHPK